MFEPLRVVQLLRHQPGPPLEGVRREQVAVIKVRQIAEKWINCVG